MFFVVCSSTFSVGVVRSSLSGLRVSEAAYVRASG